MHARGGGGGCYSYIRFDPSLAGAVTQLVKAPV